MTPEQLKARNAAISEGQKRAWRYRRDERARRSLAIAKALDDPLFWVETRNGRLIMIERQVKNALRKYLTDIGAYQYWPVPMGYGARTVDCFFCYRGRFYAVECKRPGVKSVTGAQQEILRQVAASGGGVCLENDPALPAVMEMLKCSNPM